MLTQLMGSAQGICTHLTMSGVVWNGDEGFYLNLFWHFGIHHAISHAPFCKAYNQMSLESCSEGHNILQAHLLQRDPWVRIYT